MKNQEKYNNSFLEEFLNPTKPFDGGIPIPSPQPKKKSEMRNDKKK